MYKNDNKIIKFVECYIHKSYDVGMDIFEMFKQKHMLRAFLILLFIYLIAIYPIIAADFMYIDDLERVITGYDGWGNFSRYTSVISSHLMHAGTYLADISPLPQLLAVVLITLSSVIVLSVFVEDKIRIIDMIAVLPIGLSPFYLECFSYKYDAPYMALSVLFSVVPFLFVEYDLLVYAVVSVFSMLIMCTTYQAASGIYPLMTIFLLLRMWNKKDKTCWKMLAVSIGSYIVGIGIFRFILMRPANDYVSNSVWPLNQFVSGSVSNLLDFYDAVSFFMKNSWLLLIVIICFIFLYTYVRKSSRGKVAAFFFGIAMLGIAVCVPFGLYPCLEKTLIISRSMYGVGVLIALLALHAIQGNKRYFAKIICFCLSWCLFSFSFTYGNALAEQKRYTDFRIQMVLSDLNDLEVMTTDTTKIVELDGGIGKSPVIENMLTEYRMLESLVPETFSDKNEWIWGRYYFFHYFDLRNVEEGLEGNLSEMNLPVIKDTMYHTIRGNDQYILIELKD